MLSRPVNTSATFRRGLLFWLALSVSHHANAQSVAGYYQEKFTSLDKINQSMINDLANATLDSACLTKANFDIATAHLDDESKAIATQMRDSGIKTLNDTKAWKTCKSQHEQALALSTDMSGASAWSSARVGAKRSAMLAENEEIKSGILIDNNTKVPITSEPASAFPVGADIFLEGTYGVRGSFDAVLSISEEGLVTECDVVSSIGNDGADRTICRKAQMLLRYRPAFADGRIVRSTTHLRIKVN
jgi:hypothetical protein